MRAPRTLLGKTVEFRIKDVRLPEPAEILASLHGHDLLRGRVTDLTDAGDEVDAFAVVEVAGLSQPAVIRTQCLSPHE